MTATYVLEQRGFNGHISLSITEEQYEQLSHAWEVLSEAFDFEQRYELLLANFISMEMTLTELKGRAKVGYSDSAGLLEKSNRHVKNLLTALRGYEDQVKQDFKSLDLKFTSAAEAELDKAFATSRGYRFMRTLRNYVQHKATAVHGYTSGGEHTQSDPNGWAEAVVLCRQQHPARGQDG